MLICEKIASQGEWLFRWRSYLLLALAPLFWIAVNKPEPVETHFGENADMLYEAACIALAFFGLGIRALTVGHVPAGTSGRNTTGQIAETLNTTGMYSLTRNPLYLGNAIIYMSIALFTQDIAFTITMALFLALYLERIIAAEEQFLASKFGADYLSWAREVPAFLPRFGGWRTPELPFSFRNVLRREYSGLLAIVAAFFAIDQAREFLHKGHIIPDVAGMVALAAAAVIYFTLRYLKKYTRLLTVDGR